jgi:hypothetical protein
MERNLITNLSRAGLTAAGVDRTMTPAQARAKANAELIIVLIPGDGEFYYATPDGYGCSGVSRGSWEAMEAECIKAGWIVEVAS